MRACVAAAFPGYTQGFESFMDKPYDDVKGIVTFLAGIAIWSLGQMLTYTWAKDDGTPASHDDVVACWNFLTSPEGRSTDQQGGAHYAKLVHISATMETRQKAFEDTLARFESQLRQHLTNWDDAPANAQLAALSHAWAFGGLFPATWPSWTKCFLAGDYAGASQQDMPSAHEWAAQNDSFHRRIKTEQYLLSNALQTDPDQLLSLPLPAA